MNSNLSEGMTNAETNFLDLNFVFRRIVTTYNSESQ